MARQSGLEKTLDELSVLPWWLLLLTAPTAYYGIRFGIPLIKTREPLGRWFNTSLHGILRGYLL